MLTWVELGRWQCIPATDLLVIHQSAQTDFPDKIIVGSTAEPILEDVADAESLVLTCEAAPRVLQPKPELHEAFLGVFNVNHKIFIYTILHYFFHE